MKVVVAELDVLPLTFDLTTDGNESPADFSPLGCCRLIDGDC